MHNRMTKFVTPRHLALPTSHNCRIPYDKIIHHPLAYDNDIAYGFPSFLLSIDPEVWNGEWRTMHHESEPCKCDQDVYDSS